MKTALLFALCAAVSASAQYSMLSFTGGPARVDVPANQALNPQYITIESWVYIDPTLPNIVGVQPTIFTQSGDQPYILRIDSETTRRIQFVVHTVGPTGPGINSVIAENDPIPAFEWHHVAGTYDGSTMRVYLDGNLVATTNVAGTLKTTQLETVYIGADHNIFRQWTGSLDEIRLWSYARSQEQIIETMGFRVYDQPGQIASWHFDGDYLDTTGGHNGVPMGPIQLPIANSPVAPHGLIGPSTIRPGQVAEFSIYTQFPGDTYVFDMSISGTTPGIPVPAFTVFPLNPPLLNSQLGPFPQFENFIGMSDGNRRATTLLHLPHAPELEGLRIWSAFAHFVPNFAGGVGLISRAKLSTVIAPLPEVSSISPISSPASGGWPVTVHGRFFAPGAVVKFGGSTAPSTTVINSTTLATTTPPGVIGPVDVVVENPDGGIVSTSGSFSYVADLVVTSASPILVPPGGTVTISGSGFQSGLTLTINGVSAVPSSVTSTAVTFVAPPNLACAATVVVANPDGQTGSTVVNNPVVPTFLTPPIGPSSGGYPCFVLGTNLVGITSITFGGVPATILGVSPTAILITVPPGLPGIVAVVITSSGGCSSALSYVYQ